MKTNFKLKLIFLTALATLLVSGCSSKPTPPPEVQDNAPMTQPPPPPPDHPHGPPPEALEACLNKKPENKCEFKTPRNDIIRGKCKPAHDKKLGLECRPKK